MRVSGLPTMTLPPRTPAPAPSLRLLGCPSLESCPSLATAGDGDGPGVESVDTSDLRGGRDHAMVLFADRRGGRALLGVPNGLGWRYHYGVSVPGKGGGGDRWADAEDACREALRGPGGPGVEDAPLRPAGLMLFTFPNDGGGPMRVRVLECDVSSDPGARERYGGSWYDFCSVPYDKMWDDDRLWLPRLLDGPDASYFEGHFVFDGPPGPSSRVVDYKVEFR